MPVYEWVCEKCGHREDIITTINDRDVIRPTHEHLMKRLPGGTGLLYFEEGRSRVHIALDEKPITSWSEHNRRMKQAGVVECGDNVPPSVKNNPKTIGLKRFMDHDSKRRWI